MQEVKKADVLANIGDLQKMSNVVEAFYDVDTESLTDMQAWEHIPSAEETIEGSEYAYIFIAKLNADADASAICSQLLSSGSELKGMDSDDMEINVAASGGYGFSQVLRTAQISRRSSPSQRAGKRLIPRHLSSSCFPKT